MAKVGACQSAVNKMEVKKKKERDEKSFFHDKLGL